MTHRTVPALVAALLIAAPAFAQQPPSRIANTYNGRDHQPTPAEVAGRGGAADPRTAGAEAKDERTLYKDLLGAEERDGLAKPGAARP